MKHAHRHKKQVTEFIEINSRSCEACWKCISVCPNKVIGKIDLLWHKHARIVNVSNCTGCLKCVNICESKALSKVPIIKGYVMENISELKLGSVQKTLLFPLWGRAIETQKHKPFLIDNKAVSIINSIPYDFTIITKNISRLVQLAWIARSIYFDKKIKAFIDLYPEATIVNIGCGLDTTFDRVDNGKIQWLDLDLPDTIDLRKKYISESDRRHFISKSVFDKSWYDSIENKKNVMLLIAGVLFYFDKSDVKGLFNDFHTFLSGVEIVFDYASTKGIEVSNKKVIEKGGMDKSSYLKWGINNILEIEKWNSNIKVISHMPMFKEHRKNYSIIERIGMNISDVMKIMSLAHIKIN